MLLYGRSRWGFGLLAESFRIFADVGDEGDLAALAAASPDSGDIVAAAALKLAFKRLARCVPLVLEEPATLALGAHFFPQLTAAFNPTNFPKRNAMKGRCALSARSRAVLEELGAMEQVLYDAARARAAAMLQAIDAALEQ